MIELITGHAGKAHVGSSDIGAFNASVFGKGCYILDGCEVTAPTANTVKISAGNLLLEGRHVRITGAGETVNIDSGASSYKRIDTLIAHYKRALEGVESLTFEVVKGIPVKSNLTPAAPNVPTSSILEESSDVQIPIAKILVDGLTPKIEKIVVNKWSLPLSNTSITVSSLPAPRTGTPNTIYLQML